MTGRAAERYIILANGSVRPGPTRIGGTLRVGDMTDTPRIRHFHFWLAALLAIHCAVVWYFRYTSITFGDDDAGYLLLARSLSQFHYRDLQEIGAPIAVRYPPGYPAVLALWQWLVGGSLPFLILLNVGLSAATLGLLASAVRQIWSDQLGKLCTSA